MNESGRNAGGRMLEHILMLLQLLSENGLEIDQLIEMGGWDALFSLSDSQDIRTAYEMIEFMEEMPGGFLMYYADADGQIIYANRALQRMYGCNTLKQFRKFTGNAFRGMVHPEDWEAVMQSIDGQLADSHCHLDYVEYRMRRLDGELRWIEDYGYLVRSESIGNIFYVFISDATEKKKRQQMERELLLWEKQKSEQKMQELIQEYDKERLQIHREYLRRMEVIEGLSASYESILYVDFDEDTVWPYRLSQRGDGLFDEILQMHSYTWYASRYINDHVYPEERETMFKVTTPDYIRERLAECKMYNINYRVLENGKTQYLQMHVVNVSHGERISQVVMGYRCVDEELQREMEQKQLMAEALNNANLAIVAKNAFLSNMSHDMRTPLNAIFGFTALARKSTDNVEALQNYLHRIEASGKQLLELIEEVLEIAWKESKETHQAESGGELCDLCDILQEIYEFLLPHITEKEIVFTLDCSGIRHSSVYGDLNKLKQVAMYLVNNAVTYTEAGGRITVIAEEKETLPNHYAVYQLVVADTGIGISEAFLERIFEPFTREKNTTLSGVHGTGLGLTIAKNIVDMLGGTIEAKSREGEGSTFTVTLRMRAQMQPQTASVEEVPEELPRKQKILLVEDNEINQEIETEILEELGFLIETAEDGSIAVEKMTQASPGDYDLILMDIQMPVMDGWKAARAIRSLKNPELSCIPIIALSANVFESDVQASMESGMNAHLAKPMDVALLLKTIEDVTKKKRLQN